MLDPHEFGDMSWGQKSIIAKSFKRYKKIEVYIPMNVSNLRLAIIVQTHVTQKAVSSECGRIVLVS